MLPLDFLALVKAKHGGAFGHDVEDWLQELLELLCDPRQDGERWGEYETMLLDHFMMMMLEGNSELRLPKPYKNLNGTDVAFNKIDQLELSDQAKAVIHGKVLDEVMPCAGQEAYELLIISKHILGTKTKEWMEDPDNEQWIKVTPAIDNGRGNSATYTDKDILWFVQTRALIDQRRKRDRDAFDKHQLLFYFNFPDVASTNAAIGRGTIFANMLGVQEPSVHERTYAMAPLMPSNKAEV